MVKDYGDESVRLVLETPSGLPENLRHALNVLSALGVKDDAMFLALLGDCVTADPLHLCRMIQRGLLSEVAGVRQDRIAFSGTELHVPFGDDVPIGDKEVFLPPTEVVVSLRDNALLSSYYDKEAQQYAYIANRPVFDHETLAFMDDRSDAPGEERIKALVDLIRGLQELAQSCYIAQSPLEPDTDLLNEVTALTVAD